MGRLALAAETVRASQPGPRCGVTILLDDLDDDDADELRQFLAADTNHVGHTYLAGLVKEAFGVRLSADTVSRHRRGLCSCG